MERSAPLSLDPAAWAPPADVRRWQTRSLAVGVVGSAACLAGAFLQREQFFRSYLVGWLLWLGVAAGCLALAMINHLSGGQWGLMIRRVLEAATRTFPLLALFAVPLAAGLPAVYLWARPEAVAADELLRHKAAYLNVPFFLVRTALYLAVLGGLAFVLSRASRRQDETREPAAHETLKKASGLGLVLFVLLGTFASIDFLMSLDPHWYSSLYGPIFFTGQGLSALCFAIVVAWLLAGQAPLAGVFAAKHFHDYGKLLLAFVMFWTYLSISQFIIMWQANIPEEVAWFDHRMHGGWQVLALGLILFHFAFPFMLLLSRSLKRRKGALAAVATLLFVMRWLDLHWQAAPTFSPHHLAFHWLDLAAPLAVGGLWLAAFFRELGRRPLLPVGDPDIQEVLGHG